MAADGFLMKHVHLFLRRYWSMLDPTGGHGLLRWWSRDSLLSSEPLFTSV